MGKVKEGNEVARWERWEGSEVVRWGRWESSEMARWGRWESGEVGRWEVPGFVQGLGGMQGESKISCFCF